MILFKIVPENQRIALFRDRQFLGFRGPGIILYFPYLVKRSIKLSIGDKGQLMSSDIGVFQNMQLPIRKDDDIITSNIIIKRFLKDTIIVTADKD